MLRDIIIEGSIITFIFANEETHPGRLVICPRLHVQ